MASQAIVLQQKTQRPVQFEITEPTPDAVGAWIAHAGLTTEDPFFPSRLPNRLTCRLASTHESVNRFAGVENVVSLNRIAIWQANQLIACG
jgi:hypothetical protein